MSKGDHLEFDGEVVSDDGHDRFSVKTTMGTVVQGKVGGRLRKFHIKILPGDNVKVAVSPYDLTHGIITWRERT